ncbi:MAG: DUF2019 domain-containing protein [Rhizobiaceae bacterium]|nr:DUF2019 domain-containing protein [Hyphomicrobiales bacterium]
MITNQRIKSTVTSDLVTAFERICLDQYECLLDRKIARYNRLIDKIINIREELKARGGRQALLPLLNHKNRQVRYQAAMATLLVAPASAKEALEKLSKSHEFPQAADASIALDKLADGSFVPS